MHHYIATPHPSLFIIYSSNAIISVPSLRKSRLRLRQSPPWRHLSEVNWIPSARNFIYPNWLGRKNRRSCGRTGGWNTLGWNTQLVRLGPFLQCCLLLTLWYHRSFLRTDISRSGSNTPVIHFPRHHLSGHIGTESPWLFIYVLYAPISCPVMSYTRNWKFISMLSASVIRLPRRSSSGWESASPRLSVNYIRHMPQGFMSAKP